MGLRPHPRGDPHVTLLLARGMSSRYLSSKTEHRLLPLLRANVKRDLRHCEAHRSTCGGYAQQRLVHGNRELAPGGGRFGAFSVPPLASSTPAGGDDGGAVPAGSSSSAPLTNAPQSSSSSLSSTSPSLSSTIEGGDENFDSHLMDDTDGVDDRKSPPELPAFPERHLTETVPEDMCLVCPPTQDDNGLIFGPSCTGRCFTTDDECDHEMVKVQLNKVGQYAVFPSLWWHHGYYDIKDEEKVIFTAQLFATPSSDIGSSKRSNRRNSLMNTYSHGQLSTAVIHAKTIAVAITSPSQTLSIAT